MRLLAIDHHARRQVKRVLDFACDPKRWYKLVSFANVPGDDYRHVANLSTYRCVFSITEDRNGEVFRHLSISVPSEDYPNPFAAFTIAELFGFTGWDGKSQKPPETWLIHINKEEHCIVLGQPYEKAQGKA
jgi:hypothetical protein